MENSHLFEQDGKNVNKNQNNLHHKKSLEHKKV